MTKIGYYDAISINKKTGECIGELDFSLEADAPDIWAKFAATDDGCFPSRSDWVEYRIDHNKDSTTLITPAGVCVVDDMGVDCCEQFNYTNIGSVGERSLSTRSLASLLSMLSSLFVFIFIIMAFPMFHLLKKKKSILKFLPVHNHKSALMGFIIDLIGVCAIASMNSIAGQMGFLFALALVFVFGAFPVVFLLVLIDGGSLNDMNMLFIWPIVFLYYFLLSILVSQIIHWFKKIRAKKKEGLTMRNSIKNDQSLDILSPLTDVGVNQEIDESFEKKY